MSKAPAALVVLAALAVAIPFMPGAVVLPMSVVIAVAAAAASVFLALHASR